MCDFHDITHTGLRLKFYENTFSSVFDTNLNTELDAVWRIDRRHKDEKHSQQVLYAQAIYMAGHIRCNATPKSNFMDR